MSEQVTEYENNMDTICSLNDPCDSCALALAYSRKITHYRYGEYKIEIWVRNSDLDSYDDIASIPVVLRTYRFDLECGLWIYVDCTHSYGLYTLCDLNGLYTSYGLNVERCHIDHIP